MYISIVSLVDTSIGIFKLYVYTKLSLVLKVSSNKTALVVPSYVCITIFGILSIYNVVLLEFLYSIRNSKLKLICINVDTILVVVFTLTVLR